MFNTFVDAKLNTKLKAETMAPAPMNIMLEKQPRKEETEAWRKRKSMVVQEVKERVLCISCLIVCTVKFLVF